MKFQISKQIKVTGARVITVCRLHDKVMVTNNRMSNCRHFRLNCHAEFSGGQVGLASGLPCIIIIIIQVLVSFCCVSATQQLTLLLLSV